MARPRAEGDERICRRRNRKRRRERGVGGEKPRARWRGEGARRGHLRGSAGPSQASLRLSSFGAPPAAAPQGGSERRRDATWRGGSPEAGPRPLDAASGLAPAPGAKAAADAAGGRSEGDTVPPAAARSSPTQGPRRGPDGLPAVMPVPAATSAAPRTRSGKFRALKIRSTTS